MNLPRNQMVVVGAPWAQAKPIYPAKLIAHNVPDQSVCLAIAIDEKGNVYANHPLYDISGCPASANAVEPAFVIAATNAVTSWRFLPTHLCTFPQGMDANKQGTDCAAEGATVKSIPISLTFVFTFSQRRGAQEVQTHRLSPAR